MTSNPWYREPWPWLLMAGPAAVVVAGIATTVIAVASFDGVVADDYYKRGLGINKVIAREEAAKRLGVGAAVAFGHQRSRVRVSLSGGVQPASVRLSLVHPTLQGEDQALLLANVAPGVYEAAMRTPRAGAYRLQVEDGEGRWRLGGAWSTKDDGVKLAP